MKKLLKIVGFTFLGLLLLLLLGGGLFVYKIKNGFPVSYETESPEISIPNDRTTVLLFSKATGFRHAESIEASQSAFAQLASKNGWFLYATESAGVFNADQLAQFDVVIFNNSTGRVLNDQQRVYLQEYVEKGGKLIGIHGSGDDSHHWDWYEENLLGAKFSHHPLDPQLQKATLSLEPTAEASLSSSLPATWEHTDEWYVFFENPKKNGFQILYHLDGDEIVTNGNLLWMKDKDFGMGKEHPVAWYKAVGAGKSFYTSIGHDAVAWSQEPFLQLLENAIQW